MDNNKINDIDSVRISLPTVEAKVDDDNVVWRSGCFDLNKAFVKFLCSFAISVLLLTFSIYKLTTIDKDDDRSLYISLITLILGVYLPSPQLH